MIAPSGANRRGLFFAPAGGHEEGIQPKPTIMNNGARQIANLPHVQNIRIRPRIEPGAPHDLLIVSQRPDLMPEFPAAVPIPAIARQGGPAKSFKACTE